MTKEWAPVPGQIMTRWATDVDPAAPLPEYPRPQMVREDWLNLNGLWDFSVQPAPQPIPSFADGSRILVPFAIESALSGVKRALLPSERLWYRRSFRVPEEWVGRRILLHFGAVDFQTEVQVNAGVVGSHEGGNNPFSFDITDQLNPNDNELIVSVLDGTDRERGKQTLKPGGITYTAVSGIWQTVWIEPVPDRSIASVYVVPSYPESTFSVHVDTAGEAFDGTVEIEISGGDSLVTASAQPGTTGVLAIPDARPWSPEDPFLYDVKVGLTAGGRTIDEVQSYAGMRSFSIGRDAAGVRRFFLNGAPYFHSGVLDQGYWPDGLYTAPTDEALRYDLEITKALGFNMTRKHVKVEPARWYAHCDRIGLIVWQDMPSGGAFGGGSLVALLRKLPQWLLNRIIRTRLWRIPENPKRVGRVDPESRRSFEAQQREMILALRAFPSVAAWVPFNEGWGQYDAARIARDVTSLDPTRYVDHASGWHDQLVGDIVSFHDYAESPKLPDPRRLAQDRVQALTEFGGLSLVEPGHVWNADGEMAYHHVVSHDAFADAYTRLMESVRDLAMGGLAAAVLTQLVDVEMEMNGLVTYDRKVVKVDPSLSRRLNRAVLEAASIPAR